MKKHRVAMSGVVFASLLILFIWLPLPFHVDCSLEVQPRGATPVFAGVPGRLESIAVQPGQFVEQGTVLAKLDNIDLQLEVLKLEGSKSHLEAQLQGLRTQRHTNDTASQQIPAVEEMLVTVSEQLREKTDDLNRLQIIAETNGYVFPPTPRAKRDSGDGRLPQWSGSPFDSKNRGAALAPSDQFCQIGKSTDYDAVLIVDQADVDLVSGYFDRKGKYPPVDIKLDAYRWKTVEGAIEKVASAPMEATPASLATQGGGQLETKTDRKTGTLKPISSSYQARVPLKDDRELLRVGLTGQAKIYTGWQSLYDRAFRYIARTFHFDW